MFFIIYPKVQGATFIKGFPVTYQAYYGYSEVEMRPVIENLRYYLMKGH